MFHLYIINIYEATADTDGFLFCTQDLLRDAYEIFIFQ